MKGIKRFFASLGLNILGDIVKIVIFMIPFGTILGAFINLMSQNIVLLLVFEGIVITIMCLSIVYIYIRSKQYKEDGYYFINYKKHLTVYKSGNGIIIHSFDLVVKDRSKIAYIERKINIEDGKKDAQLPVIEKMRKQNIDERFNNTGIWYYSPDNIINSVVPDMEWEKVNHPRERRWKFNIDRNKLENNHTYKIIYVLSVKDMFPIIEGKYDKAVAMIESDEGEYESSIDIKHVIKNMEYIISFENGIDLEKTPFCEQLKKREFDYYQEETIIYKKYVFRIDKPKINNKLKVKWKFSE